MPPGNAPGANRMLRERTGTLAQRGALVGEVAPPGPSGTYVRVPRRVLDRLAAPI